MFICFLSLCVLDASWSQKTSCGALKQTIVEKRLSGCRQGVYMDREVLFAPRSNPGSAIFRGFFFLSMYYILGNRSFYRQSARLQPRQRSNRRWGIRISLDPVTLHAPYGLKASVALATYATRWIYVCLAARLSWPLFLALKLSFLVSNIRMTYR